MGRYLKSYQMVLKVKGPVFVGDGKKLGKKEYIFSNISQKVIVPDMMKMIKDFKRKGILGDYERFLMRADGDFSKWLIGRGFGDSDYRRWKAYELDAGDAIEEMRSNEEMRSKKDISTFIKDAYGMPYIPGSSIKGMLRTALLSYEISEHPEKYENIARDIKENVRHFENRKTYLNRESKRIESEVFHTLDRPEQRKDNAINSCLSGMIVSDSDPVDVSCLTLCQKIDVHKDGKQRSNPVLRECLMPGTEIRFQLTIDTTICKNYDMDTIFKAIERQNEIQNKVFYSKFGKQYLLEMSDVCIGGGVGYVGKTVTYPLLGDDMGVKVITEIFKNIVKDFKKHGHDQNISLKVAPHVCKCTSFRGELYQMGICEMEVTKEL